MLAIRNKHSCQVKTKQQNNQEKTTKAFTKDYREPPKSDIPGVLSVRSKTAWEDQSLLLRNDPSKAFWSLLFSQFTEEPPEGVSCLVTGSQSRYLHLPALFTSLGLRSRLFFMNTREGHSFTQRKRRTNGEPSEARP